MEQILNPGEREDYALRAITGDGSLRLIAIDLTHTVRGVLDVQAPTDEVAPLLADLVTGAALLRLTMSPDHRLQAILKQANGGSLVADSHPDGMTRGLFSQPLDVPFALGNNTLLTVVRVTANGTLHQGVVTVDAELGISGALTGYLLSSEQVHSVLSVGSTFDEHGLRVAGGYIVQLLPGADVEVLQWITDHLENLPPVHELLQRTGGNPEVLSLEVFGELPHRILARDEVHFGCNCSEDRIVGALATLSEADLEELLDDDVLSVDCDYCGRTYEIEADRLTG